jgi:hypothetical protein
MSARKENWNDAVRKSNHSPAAPSRGATEEQLESLKEQLLVPLLAPVENAALIRELRWVANEAAALAWFTVCPLLVLPALLEEKVQAALRRWHRQQRLWKRQDSIDAKMEISALALGRFPLASMAA